MKMFLRRKKIIRGLFSLMKNLFSRIATLVFDFTIHPGMRFFIRITLSELVTKFVACSFRDACHVMKNYDRWEVGGRIIDCVAICF